MFLQINNIYLEQNKKKNNIDINNYYIVVRVKNFCTITVFCNNTINSLNINNLPLVVNTSPFTKSINNNHQSTIGVYVYEANTEIEKKIPIFSETFKSYNFTGKIKKSNKKDNKKDNKNIKKSIKNDDKNINKPLFKFKIRRMNFIVTMEIINLNWINENLFNIYQVYFDYILCPHKKIYNDGSTDHKILTFLCSAKYHDKIKYPYFRTLNRLVIYNIIGSWLVKSESTFTKEEFVDFFNKISKMTEQKFESMEFGEKSIIYYR